MVAHPEFKAEIVAIGDELTSGVRLDTNSQWLSQRLGELGILVAFHSTVGDDLDDMTQVFATAAKRANLIVVTGGLGPTADDLTRHAIADMAQVELEQDADVLQHIRGMFESRGREMPPNNAIQSMFPSGSKIIPNPEGTAPGIDTNTIGKGYRIFALPGVPVEMKQMWRQTVEPEVRAMIGDESVIHHHTLHCFGTGESSIESMLPGLMDRGRDPQIGITASSATISLRLSSRGPTIEACMAKMQPTIETIRQTLGDLVFGTNGQQLEEVVFDLLSRRSWRLKILDLGTGGEVYKTFSRLDEKQELILPFSETGELSSLEDANQLATIARNEIQSGMADLALVVGSINRDERRVRLGESFHRAWLANSAGVVTGEFRFGGHSGWRELRAVKEIINFVRLELKKHERS